jgi:hypothetical protein
MSLGKGVYHGKEHRKPYKGSKRFDRSCRNHGGCGYCEANRLIADTRKRQEVADKLREHRRGD